MNVDNMRLWVEALRSGEYKQNFGSLEKIDKDGVSRYCCLGVVCKIAMDNGVPLVRKVNYGNATYLVEDGPVPVVTGSGLPPLVSEWLGLPHKDEVKINGSGNVSLISEDGHQSTAISLNDGLEYTFAQIADAIERTYLT